MPRTDEPSPPDLVSLLKSMASDCRLDLLRQLRTPRTARDIRVLVHDGRHDRPPRPLARQTVHKHLARLQEAGLVAELPGDGAKEYVVDGPRLYEALELLRRAAAPSCMATGAAQSMEDAPRPLETACVQPRMPDAPHLVLVHGVPEGQVFRLPQEGAEVVGRSDGLEARLGHDPYVGGEHCRIEADVAGHVLVDIPGNRNGTFHNWRRLDAGERVPLRPGDVIGVGRSLLVFRSAVARREVPPSQRPAPLEIGAP